MIFLFGLKNLPRNLLEVQPVECEDERQGSRLLEVSAPIRVPYRFYYFEITMRLVEVMMQWLRLRPTFEIQLDSSRLEAIEKLKVEYNRTQPGPSFLMFGEYGELHLPVVEHRLWSPHLSFYVTEDGDEVLIRGRFAPRIEVWTFVWIVYLATAFSIFFGLIIAYSQWMLRESAWGLGIVAAGLMAMALCYVVAHIGQQFSADQMEALRRQLDCILRNSDVRLRPQTLNVDVPEVLTTI